MTENIYNPTGTLHPLNEISNRATMLLNCCRKHARDYQNALVACRFSRDYPEHKQFEATNRHNLNCHHEQCLHDMQDLQNLAALTYRHLPEVTADLRYVDISPGWRSLDTAIDWDGWEAVESELLRIKKAAYVKLLALPPAPAAPQCRLIIQSNQHGDIAILDGKPFPIKPKVAEFLSAAIEARGEYISQSAYTKSRDFDGFPKELNDLIERKTGGGSRLLPETWLS